MPPAPVVAVVAPVVAVVAPAVAAVAATAGTGSCHNPAPARTRRTTSRTARCPAACCPTAPVPAVPAPTAYPGSAGRVPTSAARAAASRACRSAAGTRRRCPGGGNDSPYRGGPTAAAPVAPTAAVVRVAPSRAAPSVAAPAPAVPTVAVRAVVAAPAAAARKARSGGRERRCRQRSGPVRVRPRGQCRRRVQQWAGPQRGRCGGGRGVGDGPWCRGFPRHGGESGRREPAAAWVPVVASAARTTRSTSARRTWSKSDPDSLFGSDERTAPPVIGG